MIQPLTPVNTATCIIAAEDDPDDRLLIREAIAEINHDLKLELAVELSVIEVEDGQELMDYLVNKSDMIPPSIILLDINMPRVSGYEALKAIRENDKLKKLPVIMLTTSSAEEDKEKVLRLGADAFISKPSSFSQLTVLLKESICGCLHQQVLKL